MIDDTSAFQTAYFMKKILSVAAVLFVILASGYLYLRFHVLKAKDVKPDNTKARSVLDLRPALIAKLRQVVKDGSKGLYSLSIQSIEPDIAARTVDLINAELVADSAVLGSMDRQRTAPDETFRISFKKLHIEGLSVSELLSGKDINLERINISYPVITVYNKEKAYNAAKRKQADSLTLYQRLTQHIKSIHIKKILVDHGTIASRNFSHKNRDATMNRVTIHMEDIRIDSSTQYDPQRFLFAKTAGISCGYFQKRTADSLYFLTVDSLSVEASTHTMTAYKLAFTPRGNKKQFQKKLPYRKDRFDLVIPKLVLQHVNWWALFNRQSLDCLTADTYGGYLHDFVDDSLPSDPKIKLANFPYQMVRKLTMPLNIRKINMHHFSFSYEEYYPESGQSGTLYFDDISARLSNIINIPAAIRPGMYCSVDATTLFMHNTPMRMSFGFDMADYRTGSFFSDLHLGVADVRVINPVIEPLAFFSAKSGKVQDLTVHMTGNNTIANTKLTMLYDDLHITALKKQKLEKGNAKKKPLLGFLANALIIKNSNTDKNGAPRSQEVSITREHGGSFFNFGWRAIRLAIFKTVGIPETLIPK